MGTRTKPNTSHVFFHDVNKGMEAEDIFHMTSSTEIPLTLEKSEEDPA